MTLEPQKNYHAIIQAFKDPKIRSIGLEGGSRSGKSFDVCIFIVQYLMTFTGKHVVIGRDLKATLPDTISHGQSMPQK